jgi:arylformamidase
MKKILLTVIFVYLSHFVNAQNYTLCSNIPYNTLTGVSQNLLNLDVYKPTNFIGSRPVMIYIHGGYWRNGDKNNIHSKATLFTDNGYVFVSINYRLSPEPVDTLSTTAVRFPIHPQDCAKAVAWVFNSIQAYSGDTSKVSLIGHSAGAHLALLLSTNETFLQNEGISLNQIKCTCSLDCGVFDVFEEIQQAGNNIPRRASLLNAFGNNPTLYDDASPQFNIQSGKAIPWLHLVHQNSSERIYANNRIKDSLVVNGYPNVSLFNANPYSHETINQLLGNPSDSIGETLSVMSFFSNCIANNLTLGSNDYSNDKSTLVIYPNPSNTIINVVCENGFQIYNSIGQLVKQDSHATTQINISNLPLGLYILRTDNKIGRFIKSN